MAEKQTTPQKQTRGNRGHYTVYTPEQKAVIGRYAAEHGNLKEVCTKFSEEYGIDVKESTVRQFKKAYFIKLNEMKDPDQITAIRGKRRGRPKGGLRDSPSKAKTAESPSSVSVMPPTTPTTGTVTTAAVDIASPSEPPKDCSVTGEYEQMVGEMAISTCITDLMNGGTAKPLVLVAFCSDGTLESKELSSIADVRAYPDVNDLSLIPEDVCLHVSYMIAGMSCAVNQKFMERCPKLKVIVTLGSLVDNIDCAYAGQVGVVICNTPDLCIEEIADSAMSFILSFYRQTPFLHTAVLAGKHLAKREEVFSGAKSARRIRGKTLGLLGLGKTGIALAQRAKAFGFNVIFYDPSTADGLEKAIGGLERVSDIADLLTKSDCISLHCSLSEESRHIINENTLRLLKRGSFLINVTHGLLVDEDALAKALKGGKIGGAALDVCSSASYSTEASLRGCPNLIRTPHVAWYSRECYGEVRMAAIHLIHQALTSLDGLSVGNCMNAHQLDIDLCRLRWTASS